MATFAIPVCCLLGSLDLSAQTALSETRTTVEKWVETRQLISRSKADWASDKDSLLQTRQLFQRELELVQKALAGITTNSTQVEKEQALAEAERKDLQEALEGAATIVASLEKEARSAILVLPEPLLATVQPLLNRIPEDPAKSKASVVERIQAVVSLLNEIDKFNNSITVANERRADASGAQMNVDTIYLGLAMAYYAEPSGKVAGIGTPSAQGWKWTAKPEIAPEVLSAIAMYRSQKPAAFTELPATIQ